MKSFKLILSTLICLLALAPLSSASAKDTWTSVRSKNFYLVGSASEKDIRKVATRLEQFRETLGRLLKVKLDSTIPINVVVFKNHDAYKQFGPKGTAGYFQSGDDVNYIALDAELQGEYPFDTIFHEYVHFMIDNNLPNVPTWFNEGLAEFYSTFDVAKDEKKVTIGAPISNHVLYLRQEKLIPFETLFAVDHKSPLYNESDKRGVFYAESWVLVHYLMHGEDGRHRQQLWKFLDQVIAGAPIGAAFQQIFQTDFKSMEKTLKSYIQRNGYPAQFIEFTNRVEADSQMQSAAMTEAEAQFYLGDLLLHRRLLDPAEKYLQQAVALDSNLARAHAALGMLNMYKQRLPEARQHLQRAVAGDSKNYLAHYYYAYVLSREGMNEGGMVKGYAPELANLIRVEAKKAIELKPEYAEAYHLLAFVNLIAGEDLDESIVLLKRAMSLSPGEQKFDYVLAQIYLRKRDFKTARQLLEPIARNSANPGMQASAQSMLNYVATYEEQMARYNEQKAAANANPEGAKSGAPFLLKKREQPGGTTVSPPVAVETDPNALLRKSMRAPRDGEQQARGLLMRVDCSEKGITFTVKVGERLLKFHSAILQSVELTSWTPEVSGDMTCGARNPPSDVVVTFRPSGDSRAKGDGEMLAIDFVPRSFVLK